MTCKPRVLVVDDERQILRALRIILRDALWFVGFMSLYAIWVTHIAGWAAETPVEPESEAAAASESRIGDAVLVETEPS